MRIAAGNGNVKELYARGVDNCILIADRNLPVPIPCATSSTLAALEKNGFDRSSPDVRRSMAIPRRWNLQTAERLNIPQVTYVDEIIDLKENSVVVKKSLEDSEEILEANLPLCFNDPLSGMNEPSLHELQRILSIHLTKK